MITLIILLPIIGSLFFFNIQETTGNSDLDTKNNSIIKQIGLSTSLVTLILTLILFSQINNSAIGFQYTNYFTPFGVLGIDSISIFYILLTAFITPIALLSD